MDSMPIVDRPVQERTLPSKETSVPEGKRERTLVYEILHSKGGPHNNFNNNNKSTGRTRRTRSRKRPLDNDDNDDIMKDPTTTASSHSTTDDDHVETTKEQATTVTPGGASTAGNVAHEDDEMETSHQDEGVQRDQGDHEARKRQRLCSTDASNATTDITREQLQDAAAQTRIRRRKQRLYYRQCLQDSPGPKITKRSKQFKPSVFIPKAPSITRHLLQQPRVLASAQIMAITWLAKLNEEKELSIKLQSSIGFRFMHQALQDAEQHAMQAQSRKKQEEEAEGPGPSQQQESTQAPLQDQSQHHVKQGRSQKKEHAEEASPSQQEETNQAPVQEQLQQPSQIQRLEELERKNAMLHMQVKALQKDYQKEREYRLTTEQELKKVKRSHKALKAKTKRNFEKHKSLAHSPSSIASSNKTSSSTSNSPMTPATTSTSRNCNSSNTIKTFHSESSQLIPRQLEHDYEEPQPEPDSKQDQHPPKDVFNRLAERDSNAREEPIDAGSPMTKDPKARKLAMPSKQTESSTNSKLADKVQSKRSSQNQMPPPPVPKRDRKTTSFKESSLDHFLEGDRVLPPPSSQASSASSEATEWHRNTQQLGLSKPNQYSKEKATESQASDDASTVARSVNLLAETQATSASTIIPPSANLLADAEPLSKFGSPSLLQGTATEIAAAPVLPPPQSTVQAESNKTDMADEEHDFEPEFEDDPVQEDSPEETVHSMPPPSPSTPKVSSTLPLPMDSPPIGQASQTTFHLGQTESRLQGQLMYHPTTVTTYPMMNNQQKPVLSEVTNVRDDTQPRQNNPARRVSVSPPNTATMQLAPYAPTQTKTRTLPRSMPARHIKKDFYSGYTRNLNRQRAQSAPKPDQVPSVPSMDSAQSRIFPGSHSANTSKALEASKKSPPANSPPPSTRKPSEQSWIQNRPYNDFMDDTPPPPVPVAAKPQQPYVRKIMGGTSKASDFRYEQVVRKKSERESMVTTDCPDCGGFFDQCERDGFRREDMRCTCRHKHNFSPNETPTDFWELSFADERKKRMEMAKSQEEEDDEEGTIQDV